MTKIYRGLAGAKLTTPVYYVDVGGDGEAVYCVPITKWTSLKAHQAASLEAFNSVVYLDHDQRTFVAFVNNQLRAFLVADGAVHTMQRKDGVCTFDRII
jgi:hypothetical protein